MRLFDAFDLASNAALNFTGDADPGVGGYGFKSHAATFQCLSDSDLSGPSRLKPTANNAAAVVDTAPTGHGAIRGAADPGLPLQPDERRVHAEFLAAAKELERSLVKAKAVQRRLRRPSMSGRAPRQACNERSRGSRRSRTTRSRSRSPGSLGDPDPPPPSSIAAPSRLSESGAVA